MAFALSDVPVEFRPRGVWGRLSCPSIIKIQMCLANLDVLRVHAMLTAVRRVLQGLVRERFWQWGRWPQPWDTENPWDGSGSVHRYYLAEKTRGAQRRPASLGTDAHVLLCGLAPPASVLQLPLYSAAFGRCRGKSCSAGLS